MKHDRRSSAPEPEAGTALVFDGQCPVCTAYSATVGRSVVLQRPIELVDARSEHPLVHSALAQGLDLDEGVVLFHRGSVFYGADAIHKLAGLSKSKGVGARLNRILFGSARVTRALYPVMKLGRSVLLRLLRRKRIGGNGSRS